MSDLEKVTTHRLVVGASPDVMKAAREAAAGVARDFYADAIMKGRCDSDEIVLVAALAILAERERCAKWHEREIYRLERQIQENDEYAARHKEGCSTANRYCRDMINCHKIAADAIRKGCTP